MQLQKLKEPCKIQILCLKNYSYREQISTI